MAEIQQNEQLQVQEQKETLQNNEDYSKIADRSKEVDKNHKLQEILSVLEDNEDEPKLSDGDLKKKIVWLLSTFNDIKDKERFADEIIKNADLLDEDILKQRIENYKLEQEDKEQTEENKENKKIMKDYDKTINDLKSSTVSLDKNNPNYWSIVDKIQKISEVNEGFENYEEVKWEVNSIIQELKQKPEVLSAILQDIPEENRKSFEQTLIKLDPEFASILPTLPYRNQILLWTNSTENIQVSNGKLTQTKDNFQTSATLDGKTRTLKLVNWKYEIANPWSENKLQTIDNVQTKLTEKVKPLQEKLNSISAILSYVNEAITQNTDLQDVKTNIKQFNEKLYNELWLDYSNSLQEIKTKLDWIYAKTEEEKDKYIKEEWLFFLNHSGWRANRTFFLDSIPKRC